MKNKKRGEIKAIVFDIGGVLLFGDKKVRYGHQNINVHEYLAKKFNLSLKKWFEKIERPYEHSITGDWSKEKVLQEMSKNLGTKSKKIEKLFIKAHKKYFKKNKILFNLTKNLKKDYLIGILSDQNYFSKEVLLNKINLNIFDPVLISCDLEIRKPNLKIYRLLKKELDKIQKTKYSEILFIDNREFNLKPAKKLGMQTILFKNNKQAIKDLNKVLNKAKN